MHVVSLCDAFEHSDKQSPSSSAMAISFSTASLVAVGVAIFFAQVARQPPAPLATFEEVRPSLYRLNYNWRILPVIPSMPVATWLVESSTLMSPKSWILIDAGTDVTANQEAILQGIKSKLSSAGGSLKLILCESPQFVSETMCSQESLLQTCQEWLAKHHLVCAAVTHGHADHVGALPKLLDAYPDVKVAYHKNEEPFISGGAQYTDLEGDTWVFNLARKALPPLNTTLISSNEAIKLDGSSGDVAEYAKWMSKDILLYHAVPGHTPGMVAFYHKPTKSVVAADSFMQISAWFPFSNAMKIGPGIPLRLGTQSLSRAKESQQKLTRISDATTYFASHDSLVGASAESFKKFVSSW